MARGPRAAPLWPSGSFRPSFRATNTGRRVACEEMVLELPAATTPSVTKVGSLKTDVATNGAVVPHTTGRPSGVPMTLLEHDHHRPEVYRDTPVLPIDAT